MQALTLKFTGFDKFAWVNPGEAPGGKHLSSAAAKIWGAFLYKQTSGACCFYRLSIGGQPKKDAGFAPPSKAMLCRWINYLYASACLQWKILDYPQRMRKASPMAAADANRLSYLLDWDSFALQAVGLLFLSMALFASHADVSEASEGEPLAIEASHGNWFEWASAWAQHLLHVALQLVGISFWTGWRCKTSYYICKLLFSLSAFPFLFLMIEFINKLFTHADATAYNQEGQLTAVDKNGLSAYLRFLRNDVLGSRRFKAELEEDFGVGVDKLKKALADGEKCLSEAWRPPSSMRAVTTRKKLEVMEVLKSVVTKEKASEALYRQCHPNAVIRDEYVEKLQRIERIAELKEIQRAEALRARKRNKKVSSMN